MKIGELARKAGCPVETIRYYEKKGLLQAPLRDIENNYRCYNNTHPVSYTHLTLPTTPYV